MQADMKLPPGQNDDLSLLHRVAARDRDALTELFLGYHARLFKFVYRVTDSYTIADELVTEVMLTVWDKAASFRGDSKVSTWIFGIAYRMSLRRLTREAMRPSSTADADRVQVEFDTAAETEDWVRQGVQSLPPAQRITVMLVFYFGLTYEEAAHVTGCPVNTVKTRMFHARRKLRELLEDSALPVLPKGRDGRA